MNATSRVRPRLGLVGGMMMAGAIVASTARPHGAASTASADAGRCTW